MKLLFLGTGAMVPTRERNVSSVLLEYEGEFILMDCGEGTQRQMNIAGYNRTKVKKILLTHWHGDHVSGLIGLIQTIGNVPHPGTLTIVGPKGTQEHMHHLTNSAIFDKRLTLDVQEVFAATPQKVLDEAKYEIWAANVDHGVPTLAFSFVEKDTRRIDLVKAESLGLRPGPLMGKLQKGNEVELDGKTITPSQVTYVQEGRKVAYVMDTVKCDNAVRIAEDAEVVICESTFLSSEHQEKAEEYDHLSARDAAEIARDANAKKLFLTHFSQRYPNVTPHLQEAKAVFRNTECAHDFLEVDMSRK